MTVQVTSLSTVAVIILICIIFPMNQHCLLFTYCGLRRYQFVNARTCFSLGRGEPSDLGNAWNLRSIVGGVFIMIGHKLVREDIVGTALLMQFETNLKHIWLSGLPHLC